MNFTEREPTELDQRDYGIQARHGSSQVIQVESLGKGAWAILTAAIVLSAVAFALGLVAWDRSRLAEREARIAQDKYTYTMGELAKQGINISTDGH